jgi:hypothetical protein
VRSSVGLMIILLGIPFFYHWRRRNVSGSHLVEATTCGLSDPTCL